jgi:hypothetical protein
MHQARHSLVSLSTLAQSTGAAGAAGMAEVLSFLPVCQARQRKGQKISQDYRPCKKKGFRELRA